MRIYSRKVRDYVPTARPVRIHMGPYNGQSSYDLLGVMDLVHYINWMNDPANEFNCKSCRENTGSKRRLPCGHQNCWVSCSIGKI